MLIFLSKLSNANLKVFAKTILVQALEVPPRKLNSCCPPLIKGTIVVERRLNNKPLPFKP